MFSRFFSRVGLLAAPFLALIMAGWLHLVAVMTLFGSLLFPLYAGGSAGLRTLNRTWPGFTVLSVSPLAFLSSLTSTPYM